MPKCDKCGEEDPEEFTGKDDFKALGFRFCDTCDGRAVRMLEDWVNE